MQKPVIALDIGHSAVKLIASHNGQREELLFRSVVTPAIQISEDGARRIADRETVEVNGRNYFFGDTAIHQGAAEVESGLSEGWVTSPVHLALFLGALKKLSQLPSAIPTDKAIIAVGLPAKYYSKQRAQLRSILQPHAPNSTIAVFPQPLGPFYALQFNHDGTENERRDLSNESWAIIEVGHFTTDFALMKDGVWIERGSGSCGGAHFVSEQLAKKLSATHKENITALEASDAIGKGFIKIFGERFDIKGDLEDPKQAFVSQVLPFAEQLLDKEARSLDGIIVAGGGANLIKEAVLQRWRNVVDSAHARFCVAEGFHRAGLNVALSMAQREAASVA
jgi:plasmid segregation protein ParM